ncbi:hypothetical protein UABAM_00355 [Candidatus Uabimicrobium amorphum]|uniref:Uncharacterized protein n=1 Tax=Uabimicrobium amorphum TaxID=2596890 RepID=A0A5S9III5_UABAM|nr:hypothetical protein UABAM_00355 [Candidatus Uabimicrobium amorphum]
MRLYSILIINCIFHINEIACNVILISKNLYLICIRLLYGFGLIEWISYTEDHHQGGFRC